MCPKYYDPQLVRKGSVDFTDSGERQTEYTYNADGALSGDANRGIAKIDYDACGYPRRVQFMDGSVTEYVYTVTGVKLRTVHRTAVPGISVAFGRTCELTEGETLSADSTDYLGNLILEDGVPSEYLFEGGYCSLDGDGISYHYYDRDHQGNIRAVVNSDGTVEQIMNYYPFGAPFSDNTAMNPDLQPYKYNGKEFESMHGRHAYDYGARFYAPLLPTWDRMDPLCEKYYHVSPYAYCANDPVNNVDVDGRIIVFAQGVSDEFINAYNQVTQYLIEHGCGEFIKILNEVDEIYTIRESRTNSFDWKTRTIEWNPYVGLDTGLTILSPAVRLNHELDHAAEFQMNPESYRQNIVEIEDEKSPDYYYSSKEEKRVITGSEKETAKLLGETDDEGNTRFDHGGMSIKTLSPISNKPLDEKLRFQLDVISNYKY